MNMKQMYITCIINILRFILCLENYLQHQFTAERALIYNTARQTLYISLCSAYAVSL